MDKMRSVEIGAGNTNFSPELNVNITNDNKHTLSMVETIEIGIENPYNLQIPENKRKKLFDVQRCFWFFTLNNYKKKDIPELQKKLNELCISGIFQEEIGEKGTPHLQGCFRTKTKKRFHQIKDVVGFTAHIEIVKNYEKAYEYCCKEKTRNGQVIIIGKPIEKLEEIETLTYNQLYPFQKTLVDIINEKAEKRIIPWIYDESGNIGKTELIKFLLTNMQTEMNKIIYASSGKDKDICHTIYSSLIDPKTKKRCANLKAFLLDLPCTTNDNNICYTTLEKVKDGMIHNQKYETGSVIFNTPHVIVCSNHLPTNMLNGRIKIYRVNDKKELIEEKQLITKKYDLDI